MVTQLAIVIFCFIIGGGVLEISSQLVLGVGFGFFVILEVALM